METNLEEDIKKTNNEEQNIENNITNEKYMKNSLLMNNLINDNTNSNYYEESYKLEELIEDNEESKDIFLSFDKDKEDNLINEYNKKTKKIKYLNPKQWKYKYKINFEEIDKQYINVKNKLNKEQIKTIINKLKEKNIDSLYKIVTGEVSKYKINHIQCFEKIKFNSLFKKTNVKDELKKFIYKYRYIFKDNNNFYRCIIFTFLENIILTNNYVFLKELLIEIDKKISINNNIIKNNDYLKNEIELYIHINLIKELLYILIKYMSKNINNSYEIFIKIYLLYEDFDYGMIFIIRYLLHEYINENKYKIYIYEDNEIEISDLLPSKYNKMHIKRKV